MNSFIDSVVDITSTGKNCKEAILSLTKKISELDNKSIYTQYNKEDDQIEYEVVFLLDNGKRKKASCVCLCKDDNHTATISFCDLPTSFYIE